MDLFRSFPLEKVRLRTQRIRDGRRIRVVLATIESGAVGPDGEAVQIAQATAVLLRRGQQPVQDFLPTPRWDAPTAADLPPVDPSSTATWDSWRIPVEHDYGMNAQNGLWIRETHFLVDKEPLTPLVRRRPGGGPRELVQCRDAAGPVVHQRRLRRLFRAPADRGDHRIQPTGHMSAHGMAAGQCVFHDETGPFGFIGVTAVGNRLMAGRPAP